MLRQKSIPWVGALVESFFASLPILSIFNFLSILVVLYTETKPYMLAHLPWITLKVFVIGATLIVVAVMAIVYKLIVPSLWHFRSNQMMNHNSDMDRKLEEILKEVKKLNGTT